MMTSRYLAGLTSSLQGGSVIQQTSNSQSQSDILAFHGLNGIHGAQGELSGHVIKLVN